MPSKKPEPGKSLAEINPELAREWNPIKNGSLTPYNILPSINKKVWWKCSKNPSHEWEAKVNNRSNGRGCPICSNRKISTSNCLAALNPLLAKEWHPTKNGELTPNDVFPSSTRKVWWKCVKGNDHEWEASVNHRATGNGCPVCSKHKIVVSNCLATLHPEIAKQWHPLKNGELSPNDVSSGSGKKVWWKCEKGADHEWESSINNRVKGSGCPVCSNQKTVDSNCLATVNPELSKEWHPTKNINLTPFDVTRGANRKVWWKCKCGHEWQAVINSRQTRGCPKCSAASAISKRNHIELEKSFGHLFPELAKEWHIVKNPDLSPFEVSPGSNKRVWWQCQKGNDHEWEASIRSRGKGSGCPVCSKQKVVFSNCLATLNPELAKEWHPTNNGSFTPNDVTPGSYVKAWWKCEKGDDHVWESTIANRSSGKGCPICLGRIVVKSNCLATVNPDLAKEWHPTKNGDLTPFEVTPRSGKKVWWKCDKGDDHEWETTVLSRNSGSGCPYCSGRFSDKHNNVGISNPEILKEWHPTKNGNLKPSDFRPISGKKVWWKCPKGDDHEWQSIIANRVKGNGCPVCSGRKTVESNCLAKLNPELAKEWHSTKNGNLTPYDVVLGSNIKAWWKCDKGVDHEWETTVVERSGGSGCPICANRKVIESNSLFVLRPDLAKEWHPTKNGDLTPNNVHPGSSFKIWWKCKYGHEWKTTASHRSYRDSGCPKCSKRISKPELRIYSELQTIFPSIQQSVLINRHEVDVYIPELKVGIEYDGIYWHQNKCEQDRKKNKALESVMLLIRVREKGLPNLSDTDILLTKPNITITTIKEVLKIILEYKDIQSKEITNKINAYLKINGWIAPEQYKKLCVEKAHIDIKDSISCLYPELAKEWHPTMNEPLLPEYFTPGSGEEVWWKCDKGEDHIWHAAITTRMKHGCPICSGHKAVNSNSLATIYPEITKQWHPTKNGELTPNQVRPGSHKRIWWKCPKGEEHIWQATVKSRTAGIGCPICSNKIVTKNNCLAKTHPDLSKEWHPTKNIGLTPHDVTYGSGQKVWWKGKCGHEWQALILNRSRRGDGCLKCRKKWSIPTYGKTKKSPGQLELM